MCAQFFLSVGQCLTPCELHACPLWVMRVHAPRLVIECDRNTDSKNKNIIGMLIRVHGPEISAAKRESMVSTIPRITPSQPSGPQFRLYKQMRSPPTSPATSTRIPVGLAGAWAGAWSGTASSPPGFSCARQDFMRLELIGNPEITNYQFNSKINKTLWGTAFC